MQDDSDPTWTDEAAQPLLDDSGTLIGYSETDTDGTTVEALDTDGDGFVDTVSIDRNGDGIIDETLTASSAGGVVVSRDDDFDGTADETETLTAQQADSLAPGLSDVLGAPLDPSGADPVPADPNGDPTTTDPQQTAPDDVAPDTGDDPAVDQETTVPIVDDGTIVGDPWSASHYWFEQSFNGSCVPASVAQIVGLYTGDPVGDQQFVDLANQDGLWSVGPDGTPGLTADSATKLLNDAGVPAHEETGSMSDLEQMLSDGRGVMLFVDAETYWTGTPNPQGADHCVVVTGVDEATGTVILSDTGTPSGNEERVPIATFEAAWADSNDTMIVCDEPAPDTSDVEQTTPAASSTSSTIADVTTSAPWALLPITLGAARAVLR